MFNDKAIKQLKALTKRKEDFKTFVRIMDSLRAFYSIKTYGMLYRQLFGRIKIGGIKS